MAASPTTAETNQHAVGLLIFDGDCGFCTTAAQKFGDFAHESTEVSPWQALGTDRLDAIGLTENDVSTAAYWIEDGVNYRGADAFAQALQSCRAPLPLLGKLLALPPLIWLARAIYPLLAKYRHKLPGATNACRIEPSS